MAELSLSHVHEVQTLLQSWGIESVVTGDIGMSYYGVDIATHDIEICIPNNTRRKAIEAIERRPERYQRLKDCVEPDFYHPYKRHAARFALKHIHPPLELFLVTDASLGFNICNRDTERGLTLQTAHRELVEYCEGVPDTVLGSLAWPSLRAFLNGWLQLAAQAVGTDNEYVHLMYAERLIDATPIDNAWCDNELKPTASAEMAKTILKDKQHRIQQSTFV